MLAGALPACALSLARIRESPSATPSAAPMAASKGESEEPQLVSSLAALGAQLRHGTVRAYLAGSCVSWFFSDILLCNHQCCSHSTARPPALMSFFFLWCL